MSKKILYIAPAASVKGGISTVIKGYLDSDLSNKYQITTISSHVDGPKWRKMLQAITGLNRLLFVMLFRNIDIVHIHGSDIISSTRKYFFFKLSHIFKRKIIYHFHGASFLDQYPVALKSCKKRIRNMFEQSNVMICLSDSWKKEILEIAPSANVEIIVNAVKIPELKNNLQKKKDDIELTFLGLIGERKGIFDLLSVMKQFVEDKNEYNIKLNIGGNGDIDRLITTIKDYNLTEIVQYMGWISKKDRDDVLRKTDIFILPSYGEGMPMAILEAMSYGIPVISTNVGGIPELVSDGITGFLIEPGNKNALYEKLKELIENENLRFEFGKKSRQSVSEKFNLDLIIKKIDAIYSGL